MDGFFETLKNPILLGAIAVIGIVGLGLQIIAMRKLRRLNGDEPQAMPPRLIAMLIGGGACFSLAATTIALAIQ